MTLKIKRFSQKSFEKRYATQKSRVEYCLSNWRDLANCDAKLTAKVWSLFYKDYLEMNGKYVALDNLEFIPRQDNIRRIRAKFNEKGMYMPTDPNVIHRRRQEEESWKETMIHD